MSNTLTDLNRNKLLFHQPSVDTALPEHFQDQYPVFVQLLNKYYHWLTHTYGDTSGRKPVSELQTIAYLKDREITADRFLAFIFDELASGLAPENFDIPRFIIKLMPFFYKTKGTPVSSQGFLKFLFGSDIDLVYPKNSMFVVGESEIGAESSKFIQDSFFYQVYSTLVRSDLPISVWRDLYKKYIHPGGWALFAEVRFETTVTNAKIPVTLPIVNLGAGAGFFTVTNTAPMSIVGIGGRSNVTVIDDTLQVRMYGDGGYNYYDASNDILNTSPYNNQYIERAEPLDVNSNRFSDGDESLYIGFNLSDSDEYFLDDSGSIFTLDRLNRILSIDFSNTIETFDENAFDFYPTIGVDSA